MRRLFLLLLAVKCWARDKVPLGRPRVALYLLGDSTHARLYETLIGVCKGVPDARVLRPLEAVRSYDFKGRACSEEAPFTRIGYLLHWGVGTPPYHAAWVTHRVANDTLNSVDNILAAVAEFQYRAAEEERRLFLFLSNLWDVRRYTDHFYDQLTVPAFVAQQRADLQTAASLLQAQMRGGDELMLQTCHLPQEAEIVTFVDALNGNALEVARMLSLPLFDEAYLVGRWVNHTEEGDVRVACPREYLGYGDGVHQGLEANQLIVAELARWAREGSSPNVLRPQAESQD